jgi:hypothetical protein
LRVGPGMKIADHIPRHRPEHGSYLQTTVFSAPSAHSFPLRSLREPDKACAGINFAGSRRGCREPQRRRERFRQSPRFAPDYIERLRQTANVSRAAREAGLASSLLYSHRKSHPAFARAWDDALHEALDALEDAVMDRVINGVAKPVFHGGKQVGEFRTYSDAMAMFVLRSKRPEIYNRTASASAPSPGPRPFSTASGNR